MAAHYDTYDYPSYWVGRQYEHESEIVALKALLSKVEKIDTLLEIGVGFGRLTPSYIYRARRVILCDPSAKLLSTTRKSYAKRKGVKIIQSCLENLPQKLKSNSIDLIIMVRVMHHLKEPDTAFSIVRRLLKKGGFLILEFPNKKHFKALIAEFVKGNITFPLDIFPKEVKGLKARKKETIPFLNFHPDIIKEKLRENGFGIKEGRSVSNIRSPFIKSILPIKTLISLESVLQRPFYYLSFGPSIFLLAQKVE